MAEAAQQTTPDVKGKRQRSPAYPGINLAQAIKRADEFYQHEKRNPAGFNAAAQHWGYSATSSGVLITAAALKSFGLMTELESGSGGRTFKISELGLRIVADKRPDSSERDAAIRQAALMPKIHAQLWRKYNGSLPSDTELSHRLNWDWQFNENAIPVFIKEFRDTISFAKLSESDTISEAGEDTDAETQAKAKIGDYIQWESGGMLRLPQAKKLVSFTPDGGFAFVEGSLTGIPVAEIIPAEAPVPDPPKPQFNPRVSEGGGSKGTQNMRQDVFSLTEGEVVISWPTPLSQASIDDLKDWMKILERKIARSLATNDEQKSASTGAEEQQ
jgi:hypothetical protein